MLQVIVATLVLLLMLKDVLRLLAHRPLLRVEDKEGQSGILLLD